MKSSTPVISGIRRKLLGVCTVSLSFCLGACSSEGNAEWQGLYQAAKSAIQTPPGVTLDQAAAIPYATLGFRINGGQEGIAVLATDEGSQQMWASGKQVTLVTIDGRIQRTVGLAYNLTWSTITPLPTGRPPLEYWQTPRRTAWTVDYRESGQYAAQISCDERPVGNETIVVLGQQVSTLRINARCTSPSLNWSFNDVYWIGRSDGVMWRSIQYIHPRLGPIELQTLRPPG